MFTRSFSEFSASVGFECTGGFSEFFRVSCFRVSCSFSEFSASEFSSFVFRSFLSRKLAKKGGAVSPHLEVRARSRLAVLSEPEPVSPEPEPVFRVKPSKSRFSRFFPAVSRHFPGLSARTQDCHASDLKIQIFLPHSACSVRCVPSVLQFLCSVCSVHCVASFGFLFFCFRDSSCKLSFSFITKASQFLAFLSCLSFQAVPQWIHFGNQPNCL